MTFGQNHCSSLLLGVADWLRTKYAVIAGQNFPGTGLNDGGTCNVPVYAIANKARENGCKFAIVDPKLTDSAPWCDEWIPISPGGDAAFALAISNVLIKEGLCNKDFLLRYTNASQLIRCDNGQALKDEEGHYLVWNAATKSAKAMPEAGRSDGLTLGLGKVVEVAVNGKTVKCETVFQVLAGEVQKYTAETSDLPEKTSEIARRLGENKPSVVFHPGMTSGRYPNWFQTMRAYSVVNLLLGNFDKPGGFEVGCQ